MADREGRVEHTGELPELQQGQERHSMAGVPQAHRRPARPCNKERLGHLPLGDVVRAPVVGAQVKIEIHRRAVIPAVVVAVREVQPDQVLGACFRGQHVAVPHA